MEQSISSLAFKGSISEAINEAKRQKKLFVVYISGENEDSVSMDKSTWSESSVAESLSKYCILLHILEGSTDAAQFSSLYPQKPAPCITAIGYNGIQLWQNEGFVSAEVLASTLEKSWLSLHVQETTATFLSAALASKQFEQTSSEAREIGSSSTSSANASASVVKKDSDNEKEKSENHAPLVEEKNLKPGDDVSHGSSVNKLKESNVKQSVTTTNIPVNQVTSSASKSGVDQKPVSQHDAKPESNVKQPVTTTYKQVKQVTASASESGVDQKPRLNVSQHETKSENIQTEEADNSDLDSKISTNIYLNIRLPGGASLQEKFEPTTTLKMVKDYVDQNQEISIGSYDLAIPYPRKVFTNQDLSKTLTELNLLNRQALTVVPHLQASGPHKARSSVTHPSVSVGPTGSSDGESYFSVVKRYLSYVNPLAYLSGGGEASAANSSTSENESGTPQGNYMGSRRSYLVTSNESSNSNINTLSSGKNKKPKSSRFGSGSNIHTLKHDEDDTKFKGQNAFWNGNSTEYGGDGDNK